MTVFSRWTLTALALLVAVPAAARDDRMSFPIADALHSPAAKEKLDPRIALYFGSQGPSAIEKTLGETRTNKKTNAFNKTDKDACEWAFVGAMIALQEQARRAGGNAVVGIESNYKNQRVASTATYVCGVGTMAAGVAFVGTIVRAR